VQTKFRQSNCLLRVGGYGVLITYIIIQFAAGAGASSVTLAWDPNSESQVAGYNVYRSNQSGSFPSTPLNGTLVRTTSFTDSTALDGTYYYVARAVSTDGKESASSNQVQVTVSAAGSSGSGTSAVRRGDFNGDGNADILWRDTVSGAVSEWLMNGAGVISQGSPGGATTDWVIANVADYNGDGRSDVLWRNTISGAVYEWLLNGTSLIGQGSVGSASLNWQIQK
jgi:VCBS repeat protein